MDDEFFFGTEIDNIDINEYLEKINKISKYYYDSCEKYKKKILFMLLY